MQLSPSGEHFVKNEEGFRPFVYDDKAHDTHKPWLPGHIVMGTLTIFYGHALRPGELGIAKYVPGQVYPESMGWEVFKTDALWVDAAIAKHVKVPLTQNQYDALWSLVFNIGAGAFRTSTLLRRLNEKNYEAAGKQFLAWKRSGHDVNLLLPRRKRELAVWNTLVKPSRKPAQAKQ